MERVVAIVQARMGSERLPGKALMDIAGKPILQHVLERLWRSTRLEDVVVATTTNDVDDAIQKFCEGRRWKCFRGSEHDVLARYADTARTYNADVVVRITADCPLIEPSVVDEVIDVYHTTSCDYASNVVQRTFPRGTDTEVIFAETLYEAENEATSPEDREHVTPYIRRHDNRYHIASVSAQEHLNRPGYRLCVDTEEDLELVRIIYDRLDADGLFSLDQVIQLLDDNPDLVEINAHVQQRELKG